MANTITGRILAISPVQTIPSKDGSKQYTKRELILDATRFDPYTGERGYENTPSFEFFGDKCAELDQYKAGQIVTISFDLQGNPYTNRDGQKKIITSVRPFKIELKQVAQQVPQQPQTQNMQPSYCQPAPTQLQTPKPIHTAQQLYGDAPAPQPGNTDPNFPF